MNAEISADKIMPGKGPAPRKVSAAATAADLLGEHPNSKKTVKATHVKKVVSGIAIVVFKTLIGFPSSSRREMLAAAKKAGYTEDEFEAALNFLAKKPALAGVNSRSGLTKVRNLSATTVEPKRFDPEEAGKRLVESLQAAEGGAWTGQELQTHFGLTSATLHRRRKEHRIIYWRDARHQFHYPQWQFTPTGALLPGIQGVLEQFRSQDEWRIVNYFLGKRAQLDGLRPLDLLRQGEGEKVLSHAKIHAEANTW